MFRRHLETTLQTDSNLLMSYILKSFLPSSLWLCIISTCCGPKKTGRNQTTASRQSECSCFFFFGLFVYRSYSASKCPDTAHDLYFFFVGKCQPPRLRPLVAAGGTLYLYLTPLWLRALPRTAISFWQRGLFFWHDTPAQKLICYS